MVTLEQALQWHQAGRLKDAEDAYKEIIQREGNNGDAYHLLGLIYFHTKRYDYSLNAIKKALQICPTGHFYWNSLGEVYRTRNSYDEAIECYEKAVAEDSSYWEAISNWGLALLSKKDFEMAIAMLERAFEIEGSNLGIMVNLGRAYTDARELEKAEKILTRAVEYKPDSWEAWINLSRVLREQQRFDEAKSAAKYAIQRCRTVPSVYNTYGSILALIGNFDLARQQYNEALQIDQKNCDALCNIAALYVAEKSYDRAIQKYNQVLSIRENHLESLYGLARVYRKLYHLSKARELGEKCIQIDPSRSEFYGFIGATLQDAGNLELARFYIKQAIDKDLKDLHGDQGLLFNYNYSDNVSPKEVLNEHRRWARRLKRIVSKSNFEEATRTKNSISDQERLRVGLVSGDWVSHPVAQFSDAILRYIDRDKIDLYCFSCVKFPNWRTEELKELPENWIDVAFLSDKQIYQKIREFGIDILVDLMGYTSDIKLSVFAKKPAPLQISFLGYPNTTGLDEIDYRITDENADPVGMTDDHFTEKLYRMPQCAWCYTPPKDAPEVSPAPVERNEYITFGSFNNLSKIGSSVKKTWIEIMKAIPDSRLLMKANGLGDAETKELLLLEFESAGVSGHRLELIGWVDSLQDHLSAYSRMDIALDSFPYNGTTTTCEAMYMGLPVIVLEGKTHRSRVGVSMLRTVGLESYIAESPSTYVAKAIKLAEDRPALIKLRSRIRNHLVNSPLMDGKNYATRLGDAFLDMWANFDR